MKVRSDFVSNSSSCSFVISNSNGALPDAVGFFSDTFKNCYIPYDVNEKITVSCSVKNKWFEQVYEKLKSEPCGNWSEYYTDWRTGRHVMKDPEKTDYDSSVGIRLETLVEMGRDDVVGMIDGIEFRCEDSDSAGVTFLRLLYAFFERNACCPNAGESEHSFVGNDSDNMFMSKLVLTCRTVSGDRAGEKGIPHG